MSDPTYLPPQWRETSPAGRSDRSSRSVTPFLLRSQGRSDGQALEFHSRLSPSPSRSWRKKRARSVSKRREDSESESVTREMDKQIEEEDVKRKERESDRKQGRKSEANRAGMSRSSTGVRREAGLVRRVERHEEEEVVRSVTIRQRRLVGGLTKTSDYSSQSDTEKELAEQRTPANRPGRLDSRRDSPRLKAFDGDEWIYSPRTGYTYARSLTYRDTATPGREVPMPHMARLPLHDITHDYSQLDQVDTTEVWEKSILEARTLAEFSEDEFSPSPPHKIFRQGAWSLAGSSRTSTNSAYSYLQTLFFLLLLPLSILLSWSKLVFRVLVYDLPALTHRIDLTLLLKSEHLTNFLTSSVTQTGQFFMVASSFVGSLIFQAIPMTLNLMTTAKTRIHALFERIREGFNPSFVLKDASGLISEDEDESGLSSFLASQKEQKLMQDRVEAQSSETVSAFSRLLNWFSPSLPQSLMDGSGLISEDEDESGLSSFLISQKKQAIDTEQAEVHPSGFISILSRFSDSILSISTYLLTLLGPRLPSNYTEAEEDEPDRVRSPRRVMFKDLPEEPETGGVSPIWVEELPEAAPESLEPPAKNFSEQQLNVEGTELPRINGLQHQSLDKTPSSKDLFSILFSPILMIKSTISSAWTYLTRQPEPELRRSRRLRGLNPEEKALERERRRRERKQNNGGKPHNLQPMTDDEDSDGESSFADLNVKEKQKLTKPKQKKIESTSLWSWIVSFFYRQKAKRRSRRLQGLGPEMEAQGVEKRRRGARRRKENISEASPSDQVEDADAEDSFSDIEEEDDEEEFVPFAMLTSLWTAITTRILNSRHGGPLDNEEAPLQKSESPEELLLNNKRKQGIIRRALESKSPFWSWGVSFFFRQKPRRRSRRLQGLEPEVDSDLDKISGRRTTRRTKAETEDVGTGLSDSDLAVAEHISDSESDSDEIEFVPWLFLVSSWQRTYSLVFGKPQTNEEASISYENPLVRMFSFISHCWTRLASKFYRPKPKRRSRRLMGLGPELEGEEARRRTRRGVKANGTKSGASPESPNMEDQEVDIAEMITRMDSEEEEEVEFIPFAIAISIWEKISSIFTSTSIEPKEQQGQSDEGEEFKDDSIPRDRMHKRFINYILTLWSWFAAVFYRPRQTRSSRRLRGLEPELKGEEMTKKTRKSARQQLNNVTDAEVDESVSKASENEEEEGEGEEFIPFAILCSLWATVKSSVLRGDAKEAQSSNGLAQSHPDTQSLWSLSWIDWGHLKQAFQSTPGEVLLSPLNGVNGGPSTSADQVVGPLFTWPTLTWMWFTSMFYREKQTRRSRRLMGLGPEMEAAEEKRKALRKRTTKGADEDLGETVVDDDGSATEKEYEFIPKLWALSIMSNFSNIFLWLRTIPAGFSTGRSDLSEENVRLHNASISAGGDLASVGTWLGNSQSGQLREGSLPATAFNEVEVTKDMVEAPNEEDIKMTKKANNMLSFLFNLGFLPTWSTSWFWPSKGTRKSRRLRGLDPVEIDALETWKSRTRAGRASAQGSVKEVDTAPSEVSEEDTSTDKYLLLLLFFLLGISLLYLAILPFCSSNPDTCRAPYRSLRKVPALVGDLVWTAGNSTVNLLHLTGDKVITGASHLKDLLAWRVHLVSSSFSGLQDLTLSLLTSPWVLLKQVVSTMGSLGTWMVDTSSTQLSSAANIASNLFNLTFSTFTKVLSSVTTGMSSVGQAAWTGATNTISSGWGGVSALVGSLGEGLRNAALASWSGMCSLPFYFGSLFMAPISILNGLTASLWEYLLFVGDFGSSSIQSILNGAGYSADLLKSLAMKPAGIVLSGLNSTASSLQILGSSSSALAASIWDGGITKTSTLINDVSSIDFTYPVFKAGEIMTDMAKTCGSSVASLLTWPFTLDFLAPFSFVLDSTSSAWSGFTSWITSLNLSAPFVGLSNLCGSIWSGAVDQISSLNIFAPFEWVGAMVSTTSNSLIGWTASWNPLAIFSWTWKLMSSSWDISTAWIKSLNPLAPFSWIGDGVMLVWSTFAEWTASLNPLAPFSTAWTFATGTFNQLASWISSLEPLAPFTWIGSGLLSMTTWMTSTLANFWSSLLDYQGFSSFHLSPIAWLFTAGNSSLAFLQDTSASAFETIYSLNFLAPLTWLWSSLTSSATFAGTSLSSVGGAVGEVFGTSVASFGLLLAAAWTRATSLVVPEKTANNNNESQLDLEQLIERVVSSNRFLSAVNEIANKKVEGESFKFQEQLATSLANQQLSMEEQSKVSADYQSRLEGIKLDVAEEIRKMTEQYMKINTESEKQSKAKADAQDLAIKGLKEKYLQMLAETEALQGSLASQKDQLEGVNQDTLREVTALKSQILVLEEQQRRLNETLASCCKNASMIEISVERHLASLVESIVTGSEGGSEAAKTFSSWLATHLVARSELEARLSSLSTDLESRLGSRAEEAGSTLKREMEEVGQQLMDKVSLDLRQEMERQLKETKAANADASSVSQGLNRTEVLEIVKNSLIQYDADKTGMFDYALETAGGSVVSTRCTETFVQKTAMYSIFGIPIWYPSNNPRTIIQPGVQPGECWAFKGSSGYIVIQLSEPIVPTRFSMEHISKSMSPSGKIDSAPKDFVVYGLRSEKDVDPVRLGAFTYSQDTDPLQFFEMTNPVDEPFPFVELDILSNHGNVNYTCLYRFRVHGLRP